MNIHLCFAASDISVGLYGASSGASVCRIHGFFCVLTSMASHDVCICAKQKGSITLSRLRPIFPKTVIVKKVNLNVEPVNNMRIMSSISFDEVKETNKLGCTSQHSPVHAVSAEGSKVFFSNEVKKTCSKSHYEMPGLEILQNKLLYSPCQCQSVKGRYGILTGKIQNCTGHNTSHETFPDKSILPSLSSAMSDGLFVTQSSLNCTTPIKTQPQVISSLSVSSQVIGTKYQRIFNASTSNVSLSVDSENNNLSKSDVLKSTNSVGFTSTQSNIIKKSSVIQNARGKPLNGNTTFGLFVPIKPKPLLIDTIQHPPKGRTVKELLDSLSQRHIGSKSASNLPYRKTSNACLKRNNSLLEKVCVRDLFPGSTCKRHDKFNLQLERESGKKVKTIPSFSDSSAFQENTKEIQKEKSSENHLEYLQSSSIKPEYVSVVCSDSLNFDKKALSKIAATEMDADTHTSTTIQFDNSFSNDEIDKQQFPKEEILTVKKEQTECDENQPVRKKAKTISGYFVTSAFQEFAKEAQMKHTFNQVLDYKKESPSKISFPETNSETGYFSNVQFDNHSSNHEREKQQFSVKKEQMMYDNRHLGQHFEDKNVIAVKKEKEDEECILAKHYNNEEGCLVMIKKDEDEEYQLHQVINDYTEHADDKRTVCVSSGDLPSKIKNCTYSFPSKDHHFLGKDYKIDKTVELSQENKSISDCETLDSESLVNYSEVFGDNLLCRMSLDEITKKAEDVWSINNFENKLSHQAFNYTSRLSTPKDSKTISNGSSFDDLFLHSLSKDTTEVLHGNIANLDQNDKEQVVEGTLDSSDMELLTKLRNVEKERIHKKELELKVVKSLALKESFTDSVPLHFAEIKNTLSEMNRRGCSEVYDDVLSTCSISQDFVDCEVEFVKIPLSDIKSEPELLGNAANSNYLYISPKPCKIENEISKKIGSFEKYFSVSDDVCKNFLNEEFTQTADALYDPSFVDISEVMEKMSNEGTSTYFNLNIQQENKNINSSLSCSDKNVFVPECNELQSDPVNCAEVGSRSDNVLDGGELHSNCKDLLIIGDNLLKRDVSHEEGLGCNVLQSHLQKKSTSNVNDDTGKTSFLEGLGLKSQSNSEAVIKNFESYKGYLDVLKDKVVSSYLKNPQIPSDRVMSFYHYLCKTGHLRAGKMTFVSEVYRNLRSTSKQQMLDDTLSPKNAKIVKEMKAQTSQCNLLASPESDSQGTFPCALDDKSTLNHDNTTVLPLVPCSASETLLYTFTSTPVSSSSLASNVFRSASERKQILTSPPTTIQHSEVTTNVSGTDQLYKPAHNQNHYNNSRIFVNDISTSKLTSVNPIENALSTSQPVTKPKTFTVSSKSTVHAPKPLLPKPITVVSSVTLPSTIQLSSVYSGCTNFIAQQPTIVTPVIARSTSGCGLVNMGQSVQESAAVLLVPVSKPINCINGEKFWIAVQPNNSQRIQKKEVLKPNSVMNYANPVKKRELQKRKNSEMLPDMSNASFITDNDKSRRGQESITIQIHDGRIVSHSSKKRQKDLECEECGKLYSMTSKFAFQRHLQQHKIKKQHFSESLNSPVETSGNSQNLDYQMKLRVRTFKCVDCGKAYTDNSILKWHIQTVHSAKAETDEETGRPVLKR
ncbi:uncharacterized protein LOC143225091 isoform X2 [Tachypleus tridentatus]|uniref:uncharacterized protein LOC143225091 isoform X2 n=1 Tax=Tachypleus tridentatus TaxID=6853 RepID=UPI003FD022E3